MAKPRAVPLRKFFPALSTPVWLLAFGRLAASLGLGFALYSSALYFTGSLGLSYTQLGLGIAASGAAGIAGRFMGGILTDRWGRRGTLLVALASLALGYALFGLANSFVLFALAHAITGFSFGLYWPANEAVVADLTEGTARQEAYALTRTADNIGLGLGALAGTAIAALTGDYRLLFFLNALAFVVFWLVVWRGVPETLPEGRAAPPRWGGYGTALADRALHIYAVANLVFTTLAAQLESTLPVYLRNFAQLDAVPIGAGFALHVALAALLQLPVARLSNRWLRTRTLMLAAALWAATMLAIWVAGLVPSLAAFFAYLAFALGALAFTFMHPASAALVAALAPEHLRGVYLSINSQCWALGYMLGPALGGALLDLPRPLSDGLWLGLALVVLCDCLVLRQLERRLPAGTNAAQI